MTEGLGPNGYTVFDPVGDAIRAAARDARRSALEEAAKVAEDLRHPNWSSETEDWVAGTVAVAAAIRALIDREPAP